MHGQEEEPIQDRDVKIDLRRIGIEWLNRVCHVSEQKEVLKYDIMMQLWNFWLCCHVPYA